MFSCLNVRNITDLIQFSKQLKTFDLFADKGMKLILGDVLDFRVIYKGLTFQNNEWHL